MNFIVVNEVVKGQGVYRRLININFVVMVSPIDDERIAHGSAHRSIVSLSMDDDVHDLKVKETFEEMQTLLHRL